MVSGAEIEGGTALGQRQEICASHLENRQGRCPSPGGRFSRREASEAGGSREGPRSFTREEACRKPTLVPVLMGLKDDSARCFNVSRRFSLAIPATAFQGICRLPEQTRAPSRGDLCILGCTKRG